MNCTLKFISNSWFDCKKSIFITIVMNWWINIILYLYTDDNGYLTHNYASQYYWLLKFILVESHSVDFKFKSNHPKNIFNACSHHKKLPNISILFYNYKRTTCLFIHIYEKNYDEKSVLGVMKIHVFLGSYYYFFFFYKFTCHKFYYNKTRY